jgi:hypothetical protein
MGLKLLMIILHAGFEVPITVAKNGIFLLVVTV